VLIQPEIRIDGPPAFFWKELEEFLELGNQPAVATGSPWKMIQRRMRTPARSPVRQFAFRPSRSETLARNQGTPHMFHAAERWQEP